MTYSRHPESPPTDGQIRFLKILAGETGTTYFRPTSFGTADSQIKELRKLPKLTATDRRREREEWGSIAVESGDAASVQEFELRGYGSKAHWR